MHRFKPLLLLGFVLTVTQAAGCGNACLKLADQICNCQPDDVLRSGCRRRFFRFGTKTSNSARRSWTPTNALATS